MRHRRRPESVDAGVVAACPECLVEGPNSALIRRMSSTTTLAEPAQRIASASIPRAIASAWFGVRSGFIGAILRPLQGGVNSVEEFGRPFAASNFAVSKLDGIAVLPNNRR